MTTSTIHESLGLDGYWRLCNLGKLTHPPTRGSILRVRANLLPINNWPDHPTTDLSKPHVCREIPIGEIPLLHTNAVLHNGKLVRKISSPWPFEHRMGFTVDVSRANLTTFHRKETDASGNLVVPVKHDGLTNDPEADAIFVGIGTAGDPYTYVVPCTEILRFFYATSSALIRAVLSDDFLDPNRNLWDTHISHIVGEEAFIQLRKRMFDVDAPFLARFAFSPYAQLQAREIFLHASGARSQDDARTIRALPPFEDTTHIVANCIAMHTGGKERWLVTRMLSCDWKPPFSHLGYNRDNDGRKDDRNIEERDASGWVEREFNCSAISPGDPPETITLANEPASTELNPWSLRSTEITERFPELAKVEVNKIPRKLATTLCDQRLSTRPLGLNDRGSVDGVKRSSELLASVLLSGLQMLPTPRGETAHDVDPSVGCNAFLRTAALLNVAQGLAVAEINFLSVTDHVATVEGVRCCVLSDDLGHEQRAWVYVDPDKTRRRLVLIAAIQRGGKFRYLIDFQHKRVNECSMLVVWDEHEGQLSVGYLGQCLLACVQVGDVSLRLLDLPTIRWGRLRHTAEATSDREAKRLIKRIYKTNNRATSVVDNLEANHVTEVA